MPTPTLDEYLDQIYPDFQEAQNSFLKEYAIQKYDHWNYDEPSGVFTFSKGDEKLYLAYQCIGSLSKTSETWLWAWANVNIYPNVKEAVEELKDFGKYRNYEKLTTAKWPAEEIDGWEMLAIAGDIFHPLGFYQVPTGNVLLFMIFTDVLTEKEVREREANAPNLVRCENHGLRRVAYVCQHLSKKEKVGFHEAFESH